jgi:hypothetical protein
MIRPVRLFVFCLLAVAFYCSVKDKLPVPDSVTSRKITLAGFLSKVAAVILDYAAQRYNVSIAKALMVPPARSSTINAPKSSGSSS